MSALQCVKQTMEIDYSAMSAEEKADSKLISRIKRSVKAMNLVGSEGKKSKLAKRMISLCNEHEHNMASFKAAIEHLPWPGAPDQRSTLFLLKEAFIIEKHPNRMDFLKKYGGIPWCQKNGPDFEAYDYLVNILVSNDNNDDYYELRSVLSSFLSHSIEKEISKEILQRRFMKKILKAYEEPDRSIDNKQDWIGENTYTPDEWMVATAIFHENIYLAKKWIKACTSRGDSYAIAHFAVQKAFENDRWDLANEFFEENIPKQASNREQFLKTGFEKAFLNHCSDQSLIINFYFQKLEPSSWMKKSQWDASKWVVDKLTDTHYPIADRTELLMSFLQGRERMVENKSSPMNSLLTVTVNNILKTQDCKEIFRRLLDRYMPTSLALKKRVGPEFIDYFIDISYGIATTKNVDNILFYLNGNEDRLFGKETLLKGVIRRLTENNKKAFAKRLFNKYKSRPYPNIKEGSYAEYSLLFIHHICQYKKDWIEFLFGNEDEKFGRDISLLVESIKRAVNFGAINFLIKLLKMYGNNVFIPKDSDTESSYGKLIVKQHLSKGKVLNLLKILEGIEQVHRETLLQIIIDEAFFEKAEDLIEGLWKKYRHLNIPSERLLLNIPPKRLVKASYGSYMVLKGFICENYRFLTTCIDSCTEHVWFQGKKITVAELIAKSSIENHCKNFFQKCLIEYDKKRSKFSKKHREYRLVCRIFHRALMEKHEEFLKLFKTTLLSIKEDLGSLFLYTLQAVITLLAKASPTGKIDKAAQEILELTISHAATGSDHLFKEICSKFSKEKYSDTLQIKHVLLDYCVEQNANQRAKMLIQKHRDDRSQVIQDEGGAFSWNFVSLAIVFAIKHRNEDVLNDCLTKYKDHLWEKVGGTSSMGAFAIETAIQYHYNTFVMKKCNKNLNNSQTREKTLNCVWRLANKYSNRALMLELFNRYRKYIPEERLYQLISSYMRSASNMLLMSKDILEYNREIRELRTSIFNLSGKKDEFLNTEILYLDIRKWLKEHRFSENDIHLIQYIVSALETINLPFLDLYTFPCSLENNFSPMPMKNFFQSIITDYYRNNITAKLSNIMTEQEIVRDESSLRAMELDPARRDCPAIRKFRDDLICCQRYLLARKSQSTQPSVLDWICAQNPDKPKNCQTLEPIRQANEMNVEQEGKSRIQDRRIDRGDEKVSSEEKSQQWHKRSEQKASSNTHSSSKRGS